MCLKKNVLMWAMLILASGTHALAQELYEWQNAAIGGGGYVTGMVIHPHDTTIRYIRTDVGGCYRWNGADSSWIQLMDWADLESRNFYGIDGIAVDPGNADVVYIAAGMYDYRTPSDVLKSTDRGKTWMRTGLNQKFRGNGSGTRYAGECLAVDPEHSNRVYAGTRYAGLWRSEDGGSTWQAAAGIPADSGGDGVRTVTFLSADTVLAASHPHGVYQSTDGGESWALMPGSPKRVMRIAGVHGNLFYVSAKTGVYRFDGSWSSISPAGTIEYAGIAVNPFDCENIICTERDGLGDRMFRTVDGGQSWTVLQARKQFDVPWWPENHFNAAASCLQFHPLIRNELWLTDWYGIWHTSDIDAVTPTWHAHEKGHEEIVSFVLKTPQTGASLLSGCADNNGFYHASPDVYPEQKFQNPVFQDTRGMDFAAGCPEFVARVGVNRYNGSGGGGFSKDGGQSWQAFTSVPVHGARGGRIAVSAIGEAMVWLPKNEKAWASNDSGKTWQACSGFPGGSITNDWTWHQPLASDRVNDQFFYYYYQGRFYRSEDRGANWKQTVSLDYQGWHTVKAAPGRPGDIWVSLDQSGLYRSVDYGDHFEKISHVQRAYLFGFGKPAPGSANPAVFVYGQVNHISGIFRSDDLGKTWIRINDDDHQIGNSPNAMAGDRQVYGRVYVGTNGSGVFYGSPADAAADPDVESPNRPENVKAQKVTAVSADMTWNASQDNDAVFVYQIWHGSRLMALSRETGYTLNHLSPGRIYTLSVRAMDASWNASPFSDSITVITLNDSLPPSNPVNVRAEPGIRSIALSWGAASDNMGIDHYDVYSDGRLVGRTANTAWLLENLSPDTEYSISIVAVDLADNASIPDAVITVRTLPEADRGTVLFVTASTDYNKGDEAVCDHLNALGFEVMAKNQSASAITDAKDKALILISSTVSSSEVNTKFKQAAVPVILWEPWLMDDMGMTGTVTDHDFGVFSSQCKLDMANSEHPIACQLSGTVTVTTQEVNFCWGNPAASADVIASVSGEPGKAAVFVYEKNVMMKSGKAPAKRAGFYWMDETAAYQTGAGWQLFDALVDWATAGSTPVQETIASPSELLMLYPNYPNPFNPETLIHYQLSQPADVCLGVYNMLGQQVKCWVNANKPAGSYSIRWNGTNVHGMRVESGVYFLRIQAGSAVKTRKMILIR